jgi:TPR repeat protein
LNLGKCYENAHNVEKNMDKARSLYQEGARRGDNDCKLAYILTIIRNELSDDRRMA